MVKRDNHYETALEEYLRTRRVPYVSVDERRRSLLGDGSLKNLDFIVSPPQSNVSLLIDVKGRRFPGAKGRQYWKNWSTTDDLKSLAHWQSLFGQRFTSLLVFAYNVVGNLAPLPESQLFEHRGALYGFVAIRLDHYASWAKVISPRWNTVALPTERFREFAKPLDAFLGS